MSDSYIQRVQARFALAELIFGDRLRRVAELVGDQLGEQLDQRLLELYGFLALTSGGATTGEDVHDAWSVWKHETDPTDRSPVPFEDLRPEQQALYQPHVDAIHRAARAL